MFYSIIKLRHILRRKCKKDTLVKPCSYLLTESDDLEEGKINSKHDTLYISLYKSQYVGFSIHLLMINNY